MLNKRFLLTSISAVLITIFMIAASYRSPAIAAHIDNALQPQSNSLQQADTPHGGNDQVPVPLPVHIANDVTSATFTMSCNGVSVSGTTSPASGYAAFRIWDDTSGTTIVDSYQNVGKPMYYAAINASGNFSIYIPYAFPQPLGHSYRARVYRAPTNAFGSWDGGATIQQSWTCIGLKLTSVSLYCDFFSMRGVAYPASGDTGVRIWVGNQMLMDSYVPGYPYNYTQIFNDGNWANADHFTPQPPGTSIRVRVYRALAATTGSWDGGQYAEYTNTCTQNLPLPTLTPSPTP